MTLGSKILVFAAVLCLLLWALFIITGAQPLQESKALQVIYGVQEDFFADAAVYRKVRNDTFFILYLPHARPAYRWWTVDFRDLTISAGSAPRTVGSRKYLLRGDRSGTKIDDRAKMGDWYWHFTETGAAFSGDGFSCSVRKNKDKDN
jgi:hypothetical protein